MDANLTCQGVPPTGNQKMRTETGTSRAAIAKLARLLVLAAWACVLPLGAAQAEQARLDSRFFTSSDGVHLHYLIGGEGPTLVFVPGWTMPASIWERQLRHFSANHRVVALDPRSQGRSEIAPAGHNPKRRSQDIKELLDTIGGEPVLLVGWSLGVLETLSYVKFHGDDRLRGLVLVDNSIGEDPPPTPSGFLKRLRKNRTKAMDGFVRSMFKTHQDEAFLKDLVQVTLRIPLDKSIRLFSTLYPRNVWRETVYATKVPLMYIVTPRLQEQGGNLKRKRPTAWVEIFTESGHALFVDEEDRFNNLLQRFITQRVWPN